MVIVSGVRGADPGIIPASPDVSFNVKALSLQETVKDFGISGNDRSNDWVIWVNGHTRFGQAGCDLSAKLIADGGQIDSADVYGNFAIQVLVQPTDRGREGIVNDAIEQSVGGTTENFASKLTRPVNGKTNVLCPPDLIQVENLLSCRILSLPPENGGHWTCS